MAPDKSSSLVPLPTRFFYSKSLSSFPELPTAFFLDLVLSPGFSWHGEVPLNIISDEASLDQSLIDRQRVRRAFIIFSFVLLPVTFAYISCPIIIEGASKGIISGGLIVFTLLFLGSLVLGRLWCAWFCPAGGLQEIYSYINDKHVIIGRLNWLKYIIFIAIIFVPLISAIRSAGGLTTIDFFYYTDHGISIAKQGAYTIYLVQIAFITVFAVLGGKRGFCHYFCPIAVIMITGRKIRNLIGWPALQLSADTSRCTGCRRCSENCLMGLDVNTMVRQGRMEHAECILCGCCVDICPNQTIRFALDGIT